MKLELTKQEKAVLLFLLSLLVIGATVYQIRGKAYPVSTNPTEHINNP